MRFKPSDLYCSRTARLKKKHPNHSEFNFWQKVFLLEEFFCGAGGVGVVPGLVDPFAGRGVPLVPTGCPGQFVAKRGDQIIERPSDYRVVVHAHVDVDQADGVAHA